jgi:antitoxin component YwqK of YwqJK toxin-antitoxin module
MAKKDFAYYHKNGTIWAKGKVDEETMEDYWEWYRSDGTLMRSGYFKNGVQTGKWTTYDKTGKPYRVTNYK